MLPRAILSALLICSPCVALAAPPSPPAPKPICELPFCRQPLAHTGQEELFMVWMDFEFGPVWLEVLPDEMIQILWEYFSFDGYAAAD